MREEGGGGGERGGGGRGGQFEGVAQGTSEGIDVLASR